ncbi:MAG: YfhO family protein, partial [Vicinamibacteria bacterium]|nr:YfhO family protein [Vicinamibacteria bacterium]
LVLYLRAGIETAEWAWERADVRAAIQHERATILESWSGLGGGFTGHRYLARLQLPGRYLIDGVRIERLSESGVLHVARIGLFDALSNRATALSQVAGFVSDTDHFRKTLSLPSVRLYELPFTRGPAHVVAGLRAVPNDGTVLRGLRAPRALDLDLRREALIVASDWQAAKPAPPATPSNQMRVEMIDRARNRIRLRAQGPGYLVVTEGWDRGWTAAVDGRAAAVLRVNHVQMAIAIEDGNHIVTLRYRPRGFVWGVALAVLAALAAIVWGRPLF